jgi:hypothetical protein
MTSHVVSGLLTKRLEISEKIAQLKNEIRHLQTGLVALDATLRLFDAEIDAHPGRVSRVRNQYFAHGEAQRLVLDALRNGDAALTTSEIASQLMERKDIELTTANTRLIQKVVFNTVGRLEKKKMVKRSSTGNELRWKLVP